MNEACEGALFLRLVFYLVPRAAEKRALGGSLTWQIAIHEAGHALAGRQLLGRIVDEIVLLPDAPAGQTRGYCRSHNPGEEPDQGAIKSLSDPELIRRIAHWLDDPCPWRPIRAAYGQALEFVAENWEGIAELAVKSILAGGKLNF